MIPVLTLRLILCLQMGDRLIPGLMPGNCSETVCVRASRFWEFYDPHDESKLLHCDLVLIDEEVRSLMFLHSHVCWL
jgi:hypothetical protein